MIKIEKIYGWDIDRRDVKDCGNYQVRIHIWGWLGWLFYKINGWSKNHWETYNKE